MYARGFSCCSYERVTNTQRIERLRMWRTCFAMFRASIARAPSRPKQVIRARACFESRRARERLKRCARIACLVGTGECAMCARVRTRLRLQPLSSPFTPVVAREIPAVVQPERVAFPELDARGTDQEATPMSWSGHNRIVWKTLIDRLELLL
jgi:hypothetical protein